MSDKSPIPSVGFLREWQILGDPDGDPPVPPIIPVSHTTWWDGIRRGRFPAPIKLGPKITVWDAAVIRKFIKDGGKCR